MKHRPRHRGGQHRPHHHPAPPQGTGGFASRSPPRRRTPRGGEGRPPRPRGQRGLRGRQPRPGVGSKERHTSPGQPHPPPGHGSAPARAALGRGPRRQPRAERRRWRRPPLPAPHLGRWLRQSPFRWYLQRCSRPHSHSQPAPYSWHSRTGLVATTTTAAASPPAAAASPASPGRRTSVNRCASRSTTATCSAVGRPGSRRWSSPCSRQPPLAHSSRSAWAASAMAAAGLPSPAGAALAGSAPSSPAPRRSARRGEETKTKPAMRGLGRGLGRGRVAGTAAPGRGRGAERGALPSCALPLPGLVPGPGGGWFRTPRGWDSPEGGTALREAPAPGA